MDFVDKIDDQLEENSELLERELDPSEPGTPTNTSWRS